MKKMVVLDWDGTLAVSTSMLTSPDGRRRKFPEELGKPMELSMSRDGVKGDYVLFLRPGLRTLLGLLKQKYQVVLWSFGVEQYIQECLHKSGLMNYFSQGLVITREQMARMNTDIKDLYLLSKFSPINETVIVDDSNEVFGILNPFNCIDAPSYGLNASDRFLDSLPHLIEFHFKNVLSRSTEDQLVTIRKDIIRAFSRRQKIAYD